MIHTIKNAVFEILLFVYVTLNPKYWVRIGTYCSATDLVIRRLIRDDVDINFDASREYVMKFENGIGVWVGNFPYGYGNLVDCVGSNNNLYPSRRTVYLLHRFIAKKKSERILKLFDKKEETT